VAPPPMDLSSSMSRNLGFDVSLHPEIRGDIRWDVSDVEETFMTQVNWLLVKHDLWNHF
jgi:hypothetical protein